MRRLCITLATLLAVASTFSVAPAATAESPAIIADVAQITVGARTTFYLVVTNRSSDLGSVDLRAALPDGTQLVASYAGEPDHNPGVFLGDAIGWISLDIASNQPWGPFVFIVEGPEPIKCTHVWMWYHAGGEQGTYVSPELCSTAPLSGTPGFGSDAESPTDDG